MAKTKKKIHLNIYNNTFYFLQMIIIIILISWNSGIFIFVEMIKFTSTSIYTYIKYPSILYVCFSFLGITLYFIPLSFFFIVFLVFKCQINRKSTNDYLKLFNHLSIYLTIPYIKKRFKKNTHTVATKLIKFLLYIYLF